MRNWKTSFFGVLGVLTLVAKVLAAPSLAQGIASLASMESAGVLAASGASFAAKDADK